GDAMDWKRWLKRTVGAVMLVLVLRTGWVIGEREVKRSAGEREYAAAVAETEETDPDWRWETLNARRPPPPAGKNAADLIRRTRAVAARVRWGAALGVEDGDPGRTADALVAMLNASRSIGDEPFHISQLVRIATRAVAARSTERALGQLSLPAGRLAGLQAAW